MQPSDEGDDLPLPEVGEVVGDKYRIERVLGRGGMGAVFEATHRVTGKRFAIKWMLPSLSAREDAIKRFVREAQVAGRFQHPNVVEVYDIAQHGDASFYMVMELLEGEPLDELLRREQRLRVDVACRILLPCMRGVARAHAAGIVHRDLKPANIFMCRATRETPERPKVLDFGISKASSAGDLEETTATKAGAIIGTPHYMSPEQVRGHGVDHRTDIYAFGVILYELVSGVRPFDATSYIDLALKIATETPEPLERLVDGTPRAFAEVVRRTMARDPAQRFATLDELALALEPFAAGLRVDPRGGPKGASLGTSPWSVGDGSALSLDTPLSTESGPFAREPARRGRVMAVLAALAAVALLVWFARALLLPPQAPPVAAPGSHEAGAGPAAPARAATSATAPPDAPAVPRRTSAGAADAPAPARAEPATAEGWVVPTAPQDAVAYERTPAPEPPAASAQPAAGTEDSAARARRAARRKRPTAEPVLAAPDPPPPPRRAEPAPRKPAGRLGVSLDEGEF